MRKSSLCVVVPAHNEEQVIDASLKALKKVIAAKHIYVVSDGSRDKTVTLAKANVPHVLELRKNVGKAKALKRLIEKFSLTNRYKYILFSDADSRLEPNFKEAIEAFVAKNPACIVGTVKSDRHGLISAFRVFEYGLSHRVYKQAQNIMQIIAVAPGCASVYRSEVLDKLNFSHHTLTEDFDLTIQIHKEKMGRIIYAPYAKVITQDPPTIKDYWKQVMRWNTGCWQNIFLHRLYLPTSKVSLELYILLLDNLAWIASFVLALMVPAFFLKVLFATFLMTFSFALVIIALEKQWWAIRYILLFPMFYFLNMGAFILSFWRALLLRNRVLAWNKVTRYS